MDEIANDDKKTRYYTGLPLYNIFDILVSKLTPVVDKTGNVGSGMSPADELVIVIMKLSQGTTNQDLAYRFGINMSKVTKVFHMWIDVLAANMKSLIKWPDREMIIATLPQCFKSCYNKVVCIIDLELTAKSYNVLPSLYSKPLQHGFLHETGIVITQLLIATIVVCL